MINNYNEKTSNYMQKNLNESINNIDNLLKNKGYLIPAISSLFVAQKHLNKLSVDCKKDNLELNKKLTDELDELTLKINNWVKNFWGEIV